MLVSPFLPAYTVIIIVHILVKQIIDVSSMGIVLTRDYRYLVLRFFNELAFLICRSIFHTALNLFEFNCEITLKSVPGTKPYNQY